MKIKIKEVHAILGEPDGAQTDRLETPMEGKEKSMIKVKIVNSKEKLKGGAGDNKPDSAFDSQQLAIGIGDETGEHTPNKLIGKEIAKDHLSQDPEYYKKLKAAGIDENAEGEASSQIKAWKNSRWMFLDTETTGLPPDKKNPTRKDPRAVQVGYAIVDNMKVVEVFNELVDPGADVEIDPTASAITGIDREKLKSSGARDFLSLTKKMKNDIESCDVIMSYNNRFDKPVIEREFKLAGIEMPNKPWLDPMIWMMKNLNLPDHKLTTIAKHYKVSLEHAHDAGADSEAAAMATMAFVQTFDGLPDDADELVKLQGVWGQELKTARMAAFRNKQKLKEADGSKNFFVLVGPPAVGKSTWIKKNFTEKGKDFAVISNDEIIEKIIFPKYGLTAKDIWSKDPNKPQEAKEAFKEMRILVADQIKQVVGSGAQNIIVDGINATKVSRANSLRIANALPDYKKIAVVFEFAGHEDKVLQGDIQRAKERGGERTPMDPEEILAKMKSITAEPPTTAEGFDEVISYNRFKDPQINEAKLSSYWKARAARRAKNASRQWPNGVDRQWALSQQDKSQTIDDSIQNIFQKELDEAEEMIDDVSGMMQKIKKTRNDMKIRRETKQSFDHPASATQKRKKGKSLSVSTSPEYGGVKKGFDKKKKKINGPVIAPGESFGPAEE
jgi:DNA polymerase-3 subunit epsilon